MSASGMPPDSIPRGAWQCSAGDNARIGQSKKPVKLYKNYSKQSTVTLTDEI